MIPGEVIAKDGDIVLNEGTPATTLTVANTGDRPVQVGSHYHFFETNEALAFDREKARGQRLDIPAGTAVRFEPGQSREVTLVPIAGKRARSSASIRKSWELWTKDSRHAKQHFHEAAYADMFGPTTVGDRVRLADTDLVIEVEEGLHHLRRGGEVRRRQGHSGRHGDSRR